MPRTGRPREFDPETVLDAAARLFWEHGYEATSMKMLLSATGLSSASFYGAYGSKKALFDAALGHYADTFGQATASLADPALAPREAIERTLKDSVRMQTDPGHPLGCLVTLSGTIAAADADDKGAATYRNGMRRHYADRVRTAVRSGELSGDTDALALATALEFVQWGIATDARDGVPRRRLLAGVDMAMTLWDNNRA